MLFLLRFPDSVQVGSLQRPGEGVDGATRALWAAEGGRDGDRVAGEHGAIYEAPWIVDVN